MTVEDLQEAFFNFDEAKSGYITLDDLRYLVSCDGEPIQDVRNKPVYPSINLFKVLFTRLKSLLPKPNNFLTEEAMLTTKHLLNVC